MPHRGGHTTVVMGMVVVVVWIGAVAVAQVMVVPMALVIHATDNQLNANVLGLLFVVFVATGETGLQISPEKVGLGMGNGEQVLGG